MNLSIVLLFFSSITLAAARTASLLLPGFIDRELEASVLGRHEDVTSYIVTCPTPVDTATRGAPREGVTVIAASSSIRLINIDKQQNTASVSCNFAGTTYAYCYAKEKTLSIQGTLAPKDLNWMDIPVIECCPTSPSTQSSIPTSQYTRPPVLSGAIDDTLLVTNFTTSFIES